MRIAWEEPFGPVLPIIRVDDVQQAIDHCNSNRLALQGCVFTRDVNQAIRISDAMETGTVQVGGCAGCSLGQARQGCVLLLLLLALVLGKCWCAGWCMW
jgi:acyl-CoA reductase-like NAD-dependent aldehyde dehydrogenase